MVFLYFLKVSTANGNQEITHNVQIRRKLKCIYFLFFLFLRESKCELPGGVIPDWEKGCCVPNMGNGPQTRRGTNPCCSRCECPSRPFQGGKENQEKLNQKHVLLVSGKLEACMQGKKSFFFRQSCYSEAKIGGGGKVDFWANI